LVKLFAAAKVSRLEIFRTPKECLNMLVHFTIKTIKRPQNGGSFDSYSDLSLLFVSLAVFGSLKKIVNWHKVC